MLPLLLTLVGRPADQQVEGVRHAEGVLLCQIVDRKGPPVPQRNSLAQQRSGGTHLEMLALKNSQPQRPRTEARILHCDTAEVGRSHSAVSVAWVKGEKKT